MGINSRSRVLRLYMGRFFAASRGRKIANSRYGNRLSFIQRIHAVSSPFAPALAASVWTVNAYPSRGVHS